MAYCIRVVLRWRGPGLQRYWVFQKLVFLGQHSLQVFTWSIVITFVVFLSGESWRHLTVAAQIGLVGAAIVSLWVPAWLHGKWRNWRLRSPATHARISIAARV
jgi:hypothetical protein